MTVLVPQKVPGRSSILLRVMAKAADLCFVFLLAGFLPYPAGPLAGFLYSIFADGINGQSVGKRIFSLQVVGMHTRKPVRWRDSLFRNAPVGVATFFGIIPVWGWLVLGLVGIPLMIIEVYLMFTVPAGHRLGDVMGDTEVIEVPRHSRYRDRHVQRYSSSA